jgi:tRNA (guanosine-2'-O-)-methyltransferase
VKINRYLQYLTSRRYRRFSRVARQRSRYFTFVFENLFDMHNISAGLRSIEAFGFQDVHIVEGKNSFQVNRDITRGAHQWLTIHQHDMVDECFRDLRQKGYRILAADPDPGKPPLHEMKFSQPTAFLFGEELYGISPRAKEMADDIFYLPIAGFVESFNVSVSVALTAYTARLYAQSSLRDDEWRLTEPEYEELLSQWILKQPVIQKIIEKEKRHG